MSIRPVIAWVYDIDTMSYVRMTQPGAGGDVTIDIPNPLPVSGTFYPEIQPVSGPLTDAELRALPLPVSGTFYLATQPISAVTLPLPAGAATEASVAALSKPSDSQHATLDDVATALRQVLQAINYPGWLDRSANQIRAQVTGSLSTAGTVSTVTTVTGLTNIDSMQGRLLIMGQSQAAWASVVRARIS